MSRGTPGIPGNPGYLEVTIYKLSGGASIKSHHFCLLEEDSFVIGSDVKVRMKDLRVILKSDKDVAQNMCLMMSISVLQVSDALNHKE